MTKQKVEHKHGVPAIFSFFIIGSGQIVKGHVNKGLVFLIGIPVFCVFLLVIGSILVNPFMWLFSFLLAFGGWIYNVYDAYNSNSPQIGKV